MARTQAFRQGHLQGHPLLCLSLSAPEREAAETLAVAIAAAAVAAGRGTSTADLIRLWAGEVA